MDHTHKTRAQLIAELEAAQRNARVEAARHRIFAAVSTMSSSEDMGRVLGLVYEGANEVGLETHIVNVVIVDAERQVSQEFMLAEEEDIIGEPYLRNVYERLDLYRTAEEPLQGITKRVWESKQGVIESHTFKSVDEAKRRAKARFGIDVSEEQLARSSIYVPFSHGMIGFNSTQPDHYRENDLKIAVDFAAMVSLGYARFLDFRQLEEKNRELELANAQTLEATRLKSQFLATMSHELRTPMNAIIGFTRLVLRRSGDLLPERQRANLEKVKLSADHLLALINEILDLSKIEAGRIDLEPVAFDLRHLIETCCATVGPTLGKPSVRLHHTVADDVPELYTDEARLRQVVINLVSNALKFTDEGEVEIAVTRHGAQIANLDTVTDSEETVAGRRPQVSGLELDVSERSGEAATFDLRPATDFLEIAVSDTGIGIPEDMQETIFEEFRQVDGSSTRQHQGTGLGLSITRKLVELMGGTISVTSEVGVGSTFTVRIPVRYGQSMEMVVAGDDVAVAPGSKRRVIVSIDDDPNVAVLLRQELEEDGYQVIAAYNADEGIALVKKHQPVAVTVDILMPGKDGWQTIAALKDDPETQDVPVIVVSAIENRSLGFSMGVHDYIVKPFNHEALKAALGRTNRR